MTPRDTIVTLLFEAEQLRGQAKQSLSSGIYSNNTALATDLLMRLDPHGSKEFVGTVKYFSKVSRPFVKNQLCNKGERFLLKCETVVREISINSINLPSVGNSDKLLRKFNAVRRLRNPETFFVGVVNALREIQGYNLIWNKDIPRELEKRKEIVKQKQIEKVMRQSKFPEGLLKKVTLSDKSSISNQLARFPEVQVSIFGALERLEKNNPDAERHCIVSCRSAIESLCMKLSNCDDWKIGLSKLCPSETDQRQIKGVFNYLSNKGAHGGYIPTKEEAKYGLEITISTLELLIQKEQVNSNYN